MFENIIGHTIVIEQMKKEIEKKSYPSSSLISGPLYSGKQTIALEAARALSCEKSRSWNCACESCRLHRVLANPGTVLIGRDYYIPEITAVRNLLEKKNETFSRYLFIRGVRKLLRRFDPDIIDDNDPKIKKTASHLSRAEELLQNFDPENTGGEKDINLKKADEIIEICKKITSESSTGNITVDQIRKISFWVRFSGYGKQKIIIIENADKMNESSRNALLKIIEEPPENVYFIFLSCKPGEIVPTVKSRLRKYELLPRTAAENRTVIEKIFREEPGIFTSIKEYINSAVPETEIIKKAARQFMLEIFNEKANEEVPGADVRKIMEQSYAEFYPDFLDEILELSGQLLGSSDFMNNSSKNIVKIGRLSSLVNECYRNHEILNINHELLTESIYFRMKSEL